MLKSIAFKFTIPINMEDFDFSIKQIFKLYFKIDKYIKEIIFVIYRKSL